MPSRPSKDFDLPKTSDREEEEKVLQKLLTRGNNNTTITLSVIGFQGPGCPQRDDRGITYKKYILNRFVFAGGWSPERSF